MSKEIKTSDREIRQLDILGEKFTEEEILETLETIDSISKQMEVGGQTTFQNKFFVLNPIEFPEGTSGKSRQAIFEAAVRVDVLKGHLFDYKKTQGEMKIIYARILRAKKKLTCEDEIETLEAEGELEIAQAEYRQKEIALENLKAKSIHVLRSIYDFWGEFNINEELCKKIGFEWKDWNKLEVEEHYWTTVNDRKVQKAATYSALGMSQQLGDSLPLQNHLEVNLNRVEHVKKKSMEEISRQMEGNNQITSDNNQQKIEQIENNKSWIVSLPDGTMSASENCTYCDNGICKYKKPIIGKCSERYCFSLGLINK